MDLKELKTKSVSELHEILADWRNKLREMRFKDSNKQLKNVRDIRVIKRNIARVLTLINKDRVEKSDKIKKSAKVANSELSDSKIDVSK